jgi:uncharacterized protein YjbI with pentapeptide repeats
MMIHLTQLTKTQNYNHTISILHVETHGRASLHNSVFYRASLHNSVFYRASLHNSVFYRASLHNWISAVRHHSVLICHQDLIYNVLGEKYLINVIHTG